MNRFKNKVCLVTGAASGIGKATAVAFAKEGANVVVSDVQEDAGNQVAADICEMGNEAIFVQCNIAEVVEVENLVHSAVEKFGRLDCAVNSAGIAGSHSLSTHEYPQDAWHQQLAVNLTGTFNCVSAQISQMLRNGGGNIVCVSSAAGLRGQPGNVPYAAAKHGIIGIVRTAAIEYATEHIRINAICPTAIKTDALLYGRRNLAENPQAMEAAVNYQAMKRMGHPEEVAAVALWLCSDEASFITGRAMPVDGGALIK